MLAFTVWGLDTGAAHTQTAASTVIRTVQQQQQHADGLSRSVTVSCTFKLLVSFVRASGGQAPLVPLPADCC